jgi:hypothetical protein
MKFRLAEYWNNIKTRMVRFLLSLFFGISAAWSAAPMPPAARAFVDQNCVGCHATAKAPAGLDLKALSFDLSQPHTYQSWVRVYDAVNKGEMPPKAPEKLERGGFLKALGGALQGQEAARVRSEGRSVLRRLNRYEYENTLRDLLHAPWLQLKDMLPEDGLVARFNKSGQALDVSHVQMARYMETAEAALGLVVAAQSQAAIDKRFYARQQKRFQGRMRYSDFNRHPERASIPILGVEAQPDVLAEKVPFTVGDADPAQRDLEGFAFTGSNYVGNEHNWDGFVAPAGGSYRLRFNALSIWVHTLLGREGKKEPNAHWRADRRRTERGRTVEPITIYALSKAGEKRWLGSFDVGPEAAIHEMQVYLLPGDVILPDAARLFRSRPGFVGSPDATEAGIPGVAYRWMDVAGPTQEPGFAEALPRTGSPQDRVKEFLRRAYRRGPTQAETERYYKIAADRMGPGPAAQAEALLAAYTAILCSPGFLYLEEVPGRLSGEALASRLSYLLWNTAPDAELRGLAASGRLLRPEVLRAQSNRLLDHPRSRNFVDAFLDYWLDLRKIGDTTPDQTLYPEYYLDDLLLESTAQETQLFFRHLLLNNLPAGRLIDAPFTMLNSHLARHYGLPPVAGVAMQKVDLPAGSVRGGLLTQASVLKVTANGTTTSPVLRGAWIMERILGEPPPPPPPGVPAVEPDTRGATTIRQQLDKHRSVAACASCHTKIDPPGFALESFDVLGAWREKYRSTDSGEPVAGIGKNGHRFAFRLGQPVDASGALASGETFSNVSELKRVLLANPRQVPRNMVSQLIAYATGTPVTFADRAAVERILDATEKEKFGLRSLLHAVIENDLFTHK